MPGKGRPFQKGISGNPGGRPKVLGDVQELARQKPEAITTLANIMNDEKAPSAARVAAANALLDRGYGKPTQPISQTLTKIDPSSITDEELAAIESSGSVTRYELRRTMALPPSRLGYQRNARSLTPFLSTSVRAWFP
jgi:hypothetical protein